MSLKQNGKEYASTWNNFILLRLIAVFQIHSEVK